MGQKPKPENTAAHMRKNLSPQHLCRGATFEELVKLSADGLRKTTDEGYLLYEKLKNTKTISYVRFKCTPSFAAYTLLHLNPHNRRINEAHLKSLVFRALGGTYSETGDVIKVAYDWFITDGQHRLSMIVVTGKTMEITFCYGVNPETRKHCDEHLKKRNARDVAEINGHELLPGMEPASRLALAYTAKSNGYIPMSNIDLVNKCMGMDRLGDLAEDIYNNNKNSKLRKNAVLLAAAWIIFKKGNNDYDEVKSFFQLVKTGTVPGDDPRWHLHNHLREQMGLGKGNQFASRMRCIKWCIYAWGLHCKGTKAAFLRWCSADGIRKNGTVKDPDFWPEIVTKEEEG